MIRLRRFIGVLGAAVAGGRSHGRSRHRQLASLVVAGLVSATSLFLAAGATAARFASAAGGAAPTCTDTFNPADSGDNWDAAGVWSSGTPTSATVACWASGVTVVSAGSDTAAAIEGGTLQIAGGTLDLANSADASTVGNVTLTSNGVLQGPSPLTIDGSFNWTGQGQLNANIVQNDGSGTCFNITGTTGQLYMTGGSVQTSCQVSIDNPGFITAGNATVTTPTTLDFAPGLQIPVNGGNNATFTAAGVAANSGPTYGTGADSLVLTGGATTVAAGTTLESGTLTVGAGQTVTVASTGALEETGGSGQIDAGGVVTGAGNLELAGGNLALDAGGTLTSGVSLQNGTLTVDSGSTYGTSSSSTSVSGGGGLVFDGAGTTGNVTLSGGSISGPAQLTIDGSFDWNAQAQLNANIVQNDGSGTCFNITGTTGQLYMTGGSVQTSCQVSIDNPGFITAGNATVTTPTTLDFAPGLQIPVNGGNNATFTAAAVAANSGPTYGTGADSLVLTGGATTVAAGDDLGVGRVDRRGWSDGDGRLDRRAGGNRRLWADRRRWHGHRRR